jgi:hypothetical protein
MSEVKVGDRVRVVIEADVLEASNFDGDGIMLEAWNYVPPVGVCGVVSIEVIPAPFVLPTKRWAQVSKDSKSLWTQTAEFGMTPVWVDLDGETLFEHELMKLSGLRVISEGISDE